MPSMDFFRVFAHHRKAFLQEIRSNKTFTNPLYYKARKLVEESISMLKLRVTDKQAESYFTLVSGELPSIPDTAIVLLEQLHLIDHFSNVENK
jgi:hypothetical protein